MNEKNISKPKLVRAVTVAQSLGFVAPALEQLEHQYQVILLSSPGREMDECVSAHGVKGYAIAMQRHISPWNDLKALCQIIRVFASERPQMVHSMTPKAGLLCMLAGWLTRVPRRIHTFTGLVWPTSKGLKRRILMLTDWITCSCATHIIPEGKGVMHDLRQITHKPMRVLGFGNIRGVDMERFSLRPAVADRAKSLRQEGVFTFFYVGRIVRAKGIDELLAAFCRLHGENPHCRLVLVGNHEKELDPISEASEALIRSNPAVIEAGPQLGDDLVAHYAAADCFVLPSYREGFPNAVLEAAAMGLPCIVTDINGSREIIEDGTNGLVVPSQNTETLHAAMREMMFHTQRTEEMAANARPMIASRFEKSFVLNCLYQFYDEIR